MIQIQKNLTKEVIRFSSYLLAFGMATILFITFLWSYFYNDKIFSFNLNQFGEALLELHVLMVVFGFLSLGLYHNYKDFKKDTIKKQQKSQQHS